MIFCSLVYWLLLRNLKKIIYINLAIHGYRTTQTCRHQTEAASFSTRSSVQLVVQWLLTCKRGLNRKPCCEVRRQYHVSGNLTRYSSSRGIYDLILFYLFLFEVSFSLLLHSPFYNSSGVSNCVSLEKMILRWFVFLKYPSFQRASLLLSGCYHNVVGTLCALITWRATNQWTN
jgi:hypothetical protein